MSKNSTKGFTIIELLIATLVFSLVLVLITVGIMSFTRAYYRGINQSRIQTVARTIAETIGQAIQFSGQDVTVPIVPSPGPDNTVGFCIGNQRYRYVLGQQLWEGTPDAAQNRVRHAFVMDKGNSCSGAVADDITGTGTLIGTELLQPRMRLSKLRVEPVAGAPDLWRISVRVVYGDNDLLESPSGDAAGPAAEDATCKFGISGSQYCAQAELTTVVKKRISQ